MRKYLKYGLVVLLIYVIFTSLGLILDHYRTSFLDIDNEFIVTTFAGTYILMKLLTGFLFNLFNIVSIQGKSLASLNFILGALVWFAFGFFLGFLVKDKETAKERFSFMGELLILIGLILLLTIAYLLPFIFRISSMGFLEGNGTKLFIIGFYAPIPFVVLGIFLWVLSWFMKKKSFSEYK